jgi:tetratricopeptide (TPR) repeat protein
MPVTAMRILQLLGPDGKKAAPVLATAFLISLGILTWRQTFIYKNLKSLWSDTLVKNPNCWLAHNNLGEQLAEEGKLDEAIAHFQAAVRIDPDSWESQINLGKALIREDRAEEALPHFRAVLNNQPGGAASFMKTGARRHGEAHRCLGVAFARIGRLDQAGIQFADALRSDPGLEGVHFAWGLTLAQQGRFADASVRYRDELRLHPGFGEARWALGEALAFERDWEKAEAQYREAIRLEPATALYHFCLAEVLERQGQAGEADRQREEATSQDSHWQISAAKLAWIRATHPDKRARNGKLALRLAKEACSATRSQWPLALDALGAALAELGQYDVAVEAARGARQKAETAGLSHLAGEIAGRIRLYKTKKPFRETKLALSP